MTARTPRPGMRLLFLLVGYFRLSLCVLALGFAIYAINARPTSPFLVGFRDAFIRSIAQVEPAHYNSHAAGTASVEPIKYLILTSLSLFFLFRRRFTALLVTLLIDTLLMVMGFRIPVWPVIGLLMLFTAKATATGATEPVVQGTASAPVPPAGA